MPFSPSGALSLIGSVPFDKTYEHTIDFANAAEQEAYFSSKAQHTFTEQTFMRKDMSINIPLGFDSLYSFNYAMYHNDTNGKIIYAFIAEKIYINDSCTKIILETDLLQTYAFDYIWHESFIEREHQDRWSGVNVPIYNLTNENLTLGQEYVQENEHLILAHEKYFLVVSSELLHSVVEGIPVMIQNYPTPFFYYIVPWSADATHMSAQGLCMLQSDNPAILSVSYIPFLPFDLETDPNCIEVTWSTTKWGGVSKTVYFLGGDVGEFGTWRTLASCNIYEAKTLPTGFATGIAKNYKYESKLLTHPFCYSLLTDYQTEPLVLKHEYLEPSVLGQNIIEVSVSQGLSHNPKSKYFISSGYKGDFSGRIINMTNGTVNDLPLKTNEYYNYMLSHKAQIVTGMAINAVQAGAAIGVGIATGGLSLIGTAGIAGNSIASIGQELAKQHDLKNIPDSVRNMGNNIQFDLADHTTCVRVIRYGVAEKIKKLLGDYFAKFGYKCSEVKVPALRSRYYYNYIKTIGCNIDGDMDNNDLAKIKGIYDRGITVWHNRAGVTPLSYQYDNVEMSLL
jgi:hypothetical protein